MSNWDFTIDSEKQLELADRIENNVENYQLKIAEMYTAINEMGESWKGDDYTMFKEGTEGYRASLSDLASSIKMYATHLKDMAKGTDTLAQELSNIIENMTQNK